MSALPDEVWEDAFTRETRHLEAASAPEFSAWQTWLELGGFASADQYARTAAAFMIAYPQVPFAAFTDGQVGIYLRGAPLKSRPIRKAHLNNWFTWGVKTRRTSSNPCDYLPVMKRAAQPVIDVFSEAEQVALEGLPLPDGPLMTLMFEAGLRLSEARSMRVERVDFVAGMVVVKEGAKGSKDRLVPIVPSLAGAIDRLVTEEGLQPSDHLWYDKPGGAFTTRLRRSKPISNSSFSRWWYRCLDDARVHYVKRDPALGVTSRGNPHVARHTFATRWRSRGLELDDLARILGHSDVSTTHRLYVHTQTAEIGERMRALLEAR